MTGEECGELVSGMTGMGWGGEYKFGKRISGLINWKQIEKGEGKMMGILVPSTATLGYSLIHFPCDPAACFQMH